MPQSESVILRTAPMGFAPIGGFMVRASKTSARLRLFGEMSIIAIATSMAANAAAQTNTNYSYDELGRVISASDPTGQVSYAYDAAGNRTLVSGQKFTIANSDSYSTFENTPVSFDPRGNDTPGSGSTLTITAVTQPQHGSATLASAGSGLTYTPNPGYVGGDSFTYTVTDTAMSAATATIEIIVNTHPPIAVNDEIYVPHVGGYTFDPTVNDSDPDHDPITVTGFTNSAHGIVSSAGGNSLTYTPLNDYGGLDSFTYTISDGHGGTATATVTVHVDRKPIANNDLFTTHTSEAITFSVTANDSDPDGDAFYVDSVGTPAHGSLVNNGGGTFTYTPNGGNDSFIYRINDGRGGLATATVTIAVISRPTAVPDTFNVNHDSSFTFDPRVNDTYADVTWMPYSVTISSVTNGAHGAVSTNGSTVTYTPAPGYWGTDNFTYTISDNIGASSTAAVTANVIPAPNHPPTANTDYVTLGSEETTYIYPLTNDTDPDGDTLQITSITQPTGGSATLVNSQTILYTAPRITGKKRIMYMMSYSISDGRGGTATSNISIGVDPPGIN